MQCSKQEKNLFQPIGVQNNFEPFLLIRGIYPVDQIVSFPKLTDKKPSKFVKF